MVMAAVISIVNKIPNVQMQIKSVSILLGISSGDLIPALHVAVLSFLLVVLYVFLGGMISVAITNVFFGALMLITMFVGSLAVILSISVAYQDSIVLLRL
jgi:Na+/proline symporter